MIIMNNRLNKAKMLPSILIGNIVSTVICIIATLIGPIFVLNGTIEDVSLRIVANIVRWIGVMAGVLIAGYIVEDKKAITAFVCAAAHILVMSLCAIAFFIIDATSLVWGLLSALLGMFVAFFVIFKQKKQVKHRRNIRRSR